MDAESTRRIWRERIEQGLSSGMPIKEWCELNHVGYSTFYKWAKRLRDEDDALPRGNESWIEISRTGGMNARALAVRPETEMAVAGAKAASAPLPPASGHRGCSAPAILIPIGAATIEIPAGARRRDVANAVSAVARI